MQSRVNDAISAPLIVSHLYFIFQSQTEDNPSSKMDLSVGVYPSMDGKGVSWYLGSPAQFELGWAQFHR